MVFLLNTEMMDDPLFCSLLDDVRRRATQPSFFLSSTTFLIFMNPQLPVSHSIGRLINNGPVTFHGFYMFL
jgi:hypothetical protein